MMRQFPLHFIPTPVNISNGVCKIVAEGKGIVPGDVDFENTVTWEELDAAAVKTMLAVIGIPVSDRVSDFFQTIRDRSLTPDIDEGIPVTYNEAAMYSLKQTFDYCYKNSIIGGNP